MAGFKSFLDRLGFGAPSEPSKAAMVLSGGGARASYQAGVLRYIAETFPDAQFPLLTGVSAGSINVAHLACSQRPFAGATSELARSWTEIEPDDVFEAPSSLGFFWKALRGRKEEDSSEMLPRSGLVDTEPLKDFLKRELGSLDGELSGVAKNIEAGRLEAAAFLTTSYTTGQSVAWVQGSDMRSWERSNRVPKQRQLTVDHIMASTSLPFLFPAIRLEEAWYGDGGIRLSDPLSPAVHLGANRILAVSTRYHRSREEARQPAVTGYPPSAQIFGVLLNAIFLDRADQDAAIMRRTNRLLENTPRRHWGKLRPIRFLMIRPSVDIGRLSAEFEPNLSGVLELMAGSLGSSETKSPDWLSMILFDPAYTERLLEIGYADGKAQKDDLERFFAD